MSATTSFIRALSPAATSMSQVFAALQEGVHPSEDILRDQRHYAILGTNNMSELVALIPSDYKAVLTEALHDLQNHMERLVGASNTLAKWRHCHSVGTIPAHLRSNPPVVQFTKDYKSKAEAAAHQESLRKAHTDYQIKCLEESMKAKADEVASLEKSIEPVYLYTHMRSIVTKRSEGVLTSHQIPIFRMEEGREVLDKWVPSPAALKHAANMQQDSVVYAERVISMVRAKDVIMQRKIQKKKDLAAAATASADQIMSNDPNSIKELIEKQIKASMKAQGLTPSGKKQKKKGKGKAKGKQTSGKPDKDGGKKNQKQANAKKLAELKDGPKKKGKGKKGKGKGKGQGKGKGKKAQEAPSSIFE
ncbi:hypothetical protein B0F90DRAFT_1668645 [Multifurca ochricompacta]|uniref:Uncharacterized protein n=1 Tax=Multifurca ochricompacta TaxID=376703 RepID=A0AAD4M4S5_9AGAM|nr:hypothetical protein B0F90DRAFT_1668645 [Multifurca ochricompacta]